MFCIVYILIIGGLIMIICKEDVYRVLSDVLGCDIQFIQQMNEEDDLAVCGMDSVSAVQLIVKLEEVYEIEFQDVDMYIERINTLGKIFELLEKYQ